MALLRAVIELIQENSPWIRFVGDRVHIPTGLLVVKWMTYYYPILEYATVIPQINGNGRLAFEVLLRKIIENYKNRGGLSKFYHDLTSEIIPFQEDFRQLVRKLQRTITNMPMRHIGQSLGNEYYSIFRVEERESLNQPKILDTTSIIAHSGTFSIPRAYYESFLFLGSFINGQDSILLKWAEFSVKASGEQITTAQAIDAISRSPVTTRDVEAAKYMYSNILQEEKSVYCVWTRKPVTTYQVDHVLPFSVMKNNDLWNLLPSTGTINRQKRDKIPSPETIEKSREMILHYWNLLHKKQEVRFSREMQMALLGPENIQNWKEKAFGQLQKACEYLISTRGYEAWRPKQ